MPEKPDQNASGTVIKAVDTLIIRVKMTIDSAKDPVIIYGDHLLLFFSALLTEPLITTGKRGSVHGARIVKNPAINEMINRVIVYCIFERISVSLFPPVHPVIGFPSLST